MASPCPPGPAAPARRGRLRADELAEAVVMADLTLALCLVAHLLPLASVLFAAAVVPMAVVALRHRLRALLGGTLAACAVGFLIAGFGLLTSLVACAALGAVVGRSARHAWGLVRTTLVGTAALWPPVAGLAVAALAVLADLRRLTIDQVRNSWSGAQHLLEDLGVSHRAVTAPDPLVQWATRDWWASVPIGLLVATLAAVAVSWVLARPTLLRVRRAVGPPAADDPADADAAPADPVPVELAGVGYHYPGGPPVLHDVSLRLDPGELVAVVGPNGSGKSTLARLLVGRVPTAGTVRRPGGAGLGHRCGSAIVFQRPEAQVLGVRVRDDLVWGLDAATVDVDAVLEHVGLRGLAERETATLSGGQLQRLAIGAALARAPRLLISDESTSMVDPEGRASLLALLRDIPARDDVAVVHVTHRRAEAALADRVVALDRGRLVDAPPTPAPPGAAPAPAGLPSEAAPRLSLSGVGHVYALGTPWAHRALTDVTLDLEAGAGLLVLGHNGSGKSTLAWVLAGVLAPTEGEARLGDEPLSRCVGHVGLAFQHARLQLLRSTVGADVAAAGGVDPAGAAAALAAVGLDPLAFGGRRVDDLSGGEMRRVALAGILARRPQALVLDEPFAGLDEEGQASLGEVLRGLRASAGLTLVVVSHDHEVPDGLVDRVVRLERGRLVPASVDELAWPDGSRDR